MPTVGPIGDRARVLWLEMCVSGKTHAPLRSLSPCFRTQTIIATVRDDPSQLVYTGQRERKKVEHS